MRQSFNQLIKHIGKWIGGDTSGENTNTNNSNNNNNNNNNLSSANVLTVSVRV